MAESGARFEWIKSNPTPIFDFLRANRLAVGVSRKRAWLYFYRSLPDFVRMSLFARYYGENRLFMQALKNCGDYEFYFDGCKNLARLELLRTIFPETKVIHLIKNPNAYLHSFLKRKNMNYHRVVNGWIRYNTTAHGFKDLLGPDKYRLITFEELTNTPEESLTKLYRFIGAPERQECFDEWIDMERIHVVGNATKNVFRRVEKKAPRWKTELRREQVAYVQKRVAETEWLAPIFPEPGVA